MTVIVPLCSSQIQIQETVTVGMQTLSTLQTRTFLHRNLTTHLVAGGAVYSQVSNFFSHVHLIIYTHTGPWCPNGQIETDSEKLTSFYQATEYQMSGKS